MIQIDPKITQIQGFDENCLWLMMKMVQIMKTYKKNRFKIATLCKYTNWSRAKVIKITKLLEDLNLISVENNTKAYGGKGANSYKITTNFLYYVGNMEGEEFIVENDEDESETALKANKTSMSTIYTSVVDEAENQSLDVAGSDVQKTDIAMAKNQPSIKVVNSNSHKAPTTSVRELVENILQDENLPYKQSLERLNLSEDEMNFLFDEVLIKNQGCTVDLLAKKVMRFAPYSKINYQKIQKAKENEDQRQKLAEARLKLEEQRIQEYHQKKTENINKIGNSDYSNSYKKPAQTFTGHIANLDVYQRDSETVTEFESRCINRENLGDVRIIKHYTKTKIVTGNDLKSKFEMAKKAMLEAKTVNY